MTPAVVSDLVARLALRWRGGPAPARVSPSAMSFLAPFFLFGALAVAAPIVFHLIRRTTREKIPFSSLMFLQPSPPRLTKRSRLENLFLLLLRCLVLGLLALGFSRPFLQKQMAADTSEGVGRRIVVLVDTSASLRREGLWADAKSRVEKILSDIRPADVVSLRAFDRDSRTLVSFEQWTSTPFNQRAALMRQQLDAVSPSWASTQLGPALLSAVEALEDKAGTNLTARRIVLVTDLQEGAHLDGLQGFDWPRGLEVSVEPVKAKRPTNAGLQLVLDREESDQASGEADIRVRVSNASTSKREQFQLGWTRQGQVGFAGKPTDIYVPPGQGRVLIAPKPPTNVPTERLLLTGDDDSFDNTAFAITPKPEKVGIVFVGSSSESDPAQLLYFLRRALQDTRRRAMQLTAWSNENSIPAILETAPALLVIAEASSAASMDRVRSVITNGATALLVMKDAASAAANLSSLLGSRATVEEAPAANYALLGQMDFEHPIFAPFADPRFSDFTKIHFWKHRRLDTNGLAGARVIARFDKGDPALVQMPLGRGTLLVLTTSWAPADSQLALSSKFVPLLYSMMELAGTVRLAPAQFLVGDTVPLQFTNAAGGVVVRKPDGSEARVETGSLFASADQPGIYTAISGVNTQRFAVNLDPAESRTAPMSVDDLEKLGVPVKPQPLLVVNPVKQKAQLHAAELEQRQKLWRWLLVAAIVVLLLETAVAGWTTRRSLAPV